MHPILLQNSCTEYDNILKSEQHPVIHDLVSHARLRESIPEYRTSASHETEDRYGPFLFDQIEDTTQDLIGRGPVELDNGAIYHGNWTKEGLRQGKGSQYWPSGFFFQGYWNQDMATGKGRLINPNGSMYQGEWKDDLAHGFGEYFSMAGANYRGLWHCDRQHGKGTEIWPDKCSYEGNFLNGLKQGTGVFTFSDGAMYDG